MNLRTLEFSLLAVALLMGALLVLNVEAAAPGVVYVAFAPVLVWALVVAVHARRSQ